MDSARFVKDSERPPCLTPSSTPLTPPPPPPGVRGFILLKTIYVACAARLAVWASLSHSPLAYFVGPPPLPRLGAMRPLHREPPRRHRWFAGVASAAMVVTHLEATAWPPLTRGESRGRRAALTAPPHGVLAPHPSRPILIRACSPDCRVHTLLWCTHARRHRQPPHFLPGSHS